ncbi:PREDICTED: oxysterol-binding protein 1 isoform X2 [Ceratosolen solmsi marchali]|uniref:Oxysterol-binding protein 1 isoform X2 n=1 Tax=Ceratosolen solmsi marchali TaxID=326594 RepID=A0AAJ6VKA3_9HYME|nr:PREDICTED: oxysterol-binding protein 1 isoform X2 [Ceratosolen solmsi marchali]
MAAVEVKMQHGGKKGWLFKWTNYIKGYRRRWFELLDGQLSYYRNPGEVSHTCRGTIYLHGAFIYSIDVCTFVVSNGGTQTFHIKAASEVERQEWVTALELAKAKAIQAMESEEDEEEYQDNDNQKNDNASTMKDLAEKLETVQKCNEILTKTGTMFQRALGELESLAFIIPELSLKIKAVNEKAMQFRVTANTMITSSAVYLQLAQQQEPKWKKMLQHERDQKVRLEKMVEQLARQHSHLEEAAQHALPPPAQGGVYRPSHTAANASPSEDDEDNAEFYDAQESDTFTLSVPAEGINSLEPAERKRNDSQGSDDGSSSEGDPTLHSSAEATRTEYYLIVTDPTDAVPQQSETTTELDGKDWKTNNGSSGSSGLSSEPSNAVSKRKRRTRVPDKPNYPLNLWSIMKNCIGKELSKIPMPVNFSEPLSMLQRLTEDYEYAEILDRAAECTDSYEQMAYVAAFTVSSYSTTASRTGKPFNPLLGETYECDRTDDLGWRSVTEQVSHHPPMVAQFCEGRNWRCWQEFTMGSKFRGKYLQVIPLGTAHLEFKTGNHHYTWRKVTTTVHNIIVGKLWVDQSGDMDIVNHKQGIKCHLKYIPYSYFSRDSQRKVKGVVMDSNKEVKWVVQGNWDSKIEIAPVISTSGTPDNPVYKPGPYTCAWKRRMPPEDCEKYYYFTELACQLNEPEDGIAPTDSRLRPDQRLMENGLWDEANTEKLRLEEKQRSVRRARENDAEKSASEGLPYSAYEPLWFKKQEDPYTDSFCHTYNGEYWKCKSKQDWGRCPNIF